MDQEQEKDSTDTGGGAPHDRSEGYADRPFTRRSFVKAAGLGAFFAGGTGAALTPMLNYDNDVSFEAAIQQQYEHLTPEKMEKILRRLEKEVEERHGVKCTIEDPKPLPGVEFAYALNIGRCIGCRGKPAILVG